VSSQDQEYNCDHKSYEDRHTNFDDDVLQLYIAIHGWWMNIIKTLFERVESDWPYDKPDEFDCQLECEALTS